MPQGVVKSFNVTWNGFATLGLIFTWLKNLFG
ncbi:hypothetical protein wcw_1096 [Waddlia chondrophila WSU 86-1044]|uniref:Uncharacterized protein n=1 Tax=Waddlia chondrophila (strain ATCC VR-1470 / WSU 86-1044) TaxID=716544 RepID=D6YWE2_WADCW|nr:hypothetical protein wcw_1096 [Waddlia chondrophila WSU 86-1044]